MKIIRHLIFGWLLGLVFPLHAQIYRDSIEFANGASIASVLHVSGNPPLVLPAVKYTAPYHRFTGKIIGNQPEHVDLLPLAYGTVDLNLSTGIAIRNSTGNFDVELSGTGKTRIVFDDTSIETEKLLILVTPHSPPQATQALVFPMVGADSHKLDVQMYSPTGSATAISYSYSFQVIRP